MDKLADVAVVEKSKNEASDGKPKKPKNKGVSNQGSIIEGCFYEINHEKLPRKSPDLLKTIRIVQVNEKTANEVSIIFPSTSSLRKHNETLGGWPELDEEYRIVGTTRAARVLYRLVSGKEWIRRVHLKSFWHVSGEVSDSVELRDKSANKEVSVEPKSLSVMESAGSCTDRKVRGINKVEQSFGLKTDDSNQRQCKRVLENSDDGGPEKLKKMKLDKDIKGSSSERFSEHLNRMGDQITSLFDEMMADRLDQFHHRILDRVKRVERKAAARSR